jgi:hypothetical protein
LTGPKNEIVEPLRAQSADVGSRAIVTGSPDVAVADTVIAELVVNSWVGSVDGVITFASCDTKKLEEVVLAAPSTASSV